MTRCVASSRFRPYRFALTGWICLLFLVSWPFETCGYDRETAVVKAVNRVAPAVVNINSEQVVRGRTKPFSGFGMNPFFDSFFKDFFDPGFERRYQRTSLGSGVIIDGERGFILTNAHVITNAGKVSVVFQDEREYDAQIVGVDRDSDLAVLKIAPTEALPVVAMASSEDLMIGESVIAIGNPFGFSHTVTTGVISALHRNIRTEEHVYRDFIQIDASINPGNSGGPLLNINGDLIGINTAVYAKAQGIGFAIPIDKARKIVNDLIRYGEVVPAWIGITVQDLDPDLADYYKLPSVQSKDNTGIVVRAVQSQSPARKAGIRKGDIILAVGAKPVPSSEEYQLIMREFAAGDTLKLTLWRAVEEQLVTVTSTVFPEQMAPELVQDLMGMAVENLTKKNRRKFQTSTDKGVVITRLDQSAPLAQIGAQPGDILRQIDEIEIENIEVFYKAMVKYRQKASVVILLQRNDQLYYITVPLAG